MSRVVSSIIWQLSSDCNIYFIEYMAEAALQTGILFDSTFTGKASYGLSDLMQNRPEVFKGRRILFVHSGKYWWHCCLLKDFMSFVTKLVLLQ